MSSLNNFTDSLPWPISSDGSSDIVFYIILWVGIIMLGMLGMVTLTVLEWILGCLVDTYLAFCNRVKNRRFAQKGRHVRRIRPRHSEPFCRKLR